MSKEHWKSGNMLYPLPAVMVSVGTMEKSNIITVAWAGTVCTNPAYVSISVRKERYSYNIIKDSKEFVLNLVTKDLTKACDYCGVVSGSKFDKFKETGLTKMESLYVKAPSIMESPVSIECSVEQIISLGSHDMFIAKVLGVTIENELMDEKNKFCLNSADLICYSHGEYFTLGEKIGKFGYSVAKK